MSKNILIFFMAIIIIGAYSPITTLGMTTRYTPKSTVSFTGHTSYCPGATASPNTLIYGQCSSGSSSTSGTPCTAQWYYNATGDTIAATSVPLGSPVSFTSAASSTGTISYTPLTTPGTLYYFVRMTMPSGSCNSLFTSMPQMVTVGITAPDTISGPNMVCTGATTLLSDATGGGTWSSDVTSVATIDAASGVVSGVSPGMAQITYTTSCGSVTYSVSVIASPSITGLDTACVGATPTTLTATPAGGTWSSHWPSLATVDAAGDVTGLSRGTVVITYTMPSTCIATHTVTVDQAPEPIVGDSIVCVGRSLNLYEEISGGIWSSSNNSVAYCTSDIVSGHSAGHANISYTNGCGVAVRPVTVNPLPTPVVIEDAASNALKTTTFYTAYQWYLGTNYSTATAITGAVTYRLLSPVAGQHYIVDVADVNGCWGHSAAYIYTLGVSNVGLKDKVSIYPNPVSGILHITATAEVNAVITDMVGKIIVSKQNAKEIDMHNIPSGTYIMTLYDENSVLVQHQAITKIDQ